MNKTLFHDYEGFVEKFKPKKTTDDCYTPPEVYQAVLEYVGALIDIKELKVLRPFKPGGDYENEDYDAQTIVIDNPPFSILSQIVRFYEKRGIKYFLFAPHLTVFSTKAKTSILTNADIIYENGAQINTDFVSNLFGDVRIKTAPTLRSAIKAAQREMRQKKKELPKYSYPAHVITSTTFDRMIIEGLEFEIRDNECHRITKLRSQIPYGKGIFGSGYLINTERAEKLRAEMLRAEKLRAEKPITEWPLTAQEYAVIELLDKNR